MANIHAEHSSVYIATIRDMSATGPVVFVVGLWNSRMRRNRWKNITCCVLGPGTCFISITVLDKRQRQWGSFTLTDSTYAVDNGYGWLMMSEDLLRYEGRNQKYSRLVFGMWYARLKHICSLTIAKYANRARLQWPRSCATNPLWTDRCRWNRELFVAELGMILSL